MTRSRSALRYIRPRATAFGVVAVLTVGGCATSNETATSSAKAGAADAGKCDVTKEGDVKSSGLEAPPTKKTGTLKIGFSPTAMDTYYKRVLAGVQEGIDSAGGKSKIKLDVQAPSSQSATDDQVRSVEAWISQGYDAIAVALYNENALEPLFKKASAKGIPIFTFNSPVVCSPYYVSNIGYDQSEGGRAQAQWIVDHYKNKGTVKIAMLEGLPGPHTSERLRGFNAVLSKYPDLKVVTSQPAGWTRAQGLSVTENILTAHPDIDILVALYDEMALGGLEAIKARGLTGDIAVVGYENMSEANAAIKKGDFAATVDTGAKQEGRNIISTIEKYVAQGERVPRTVFDKVTVYDKTNIDSFDPDDYGYVPPAKKK
ncbi:MULTISPECIES: sugar ABC transporter substrate-binding protein [Streptomyces]|uniref:Sugar ABC transporter substrate-binding protein n=2 Tax=Streptomyces TaxID=1883 RepID=A0ABV9JA70_9ACTN